MPRKFLKVACLQAFLSAVSCWAASSSAPLDAAGYRLQVLIQQADGPHTLKTWSLDELKALKLTSSKEKDPASGEVPHWKGVLLSQVLEKAMSEMTPDRRAQVDLVILKGAAGTQALVPRAFVVKFPMLLAMEKNQKPLLGTPSGPVYSVVPWTTKSKVAQEALPVESFFVPSIVQIELTNYRERYAGLFLKKRTDPAAMRGEKIFVQNCVTCHAAGRAPSLEQVTHVSPDQRAKVLTSGKHPGNAGYGKLSEKEQRSLMSYFEAHYAENTSTAGTSPSKSGFSFFGNAQAGH